MAHCFVRERLVLLLLSVSALRGDGRSLQSNDIFTEDLISFLNSELKREMPEEVIYRRPLRCLDMVSVEGEFTFTAARPELSCAAFIMADADQVVTVDYRGDAVDCPGGDFVTVFDGWVMKGAEFPSSLDHPLPLRQRYVNYCDASSPRKTVRSNQNVAMVFFRIHNVGSSFTLTIRNHVNPFPCNVISQSPGGSYSMVVPQQRRNCSFSIVYPVAVHVQEFSLGAFDDLPKRSSMLGCSDSGDFVQLLGGTSLDPQKLVPITDFCVSFTGPIHLKVGCDNTVVRMVSSGSFVNRLSFSYKLLENHELQNIKENNVEDFCFNN